MKLPIYAAVAISLSIGMNGQFVRAQNNASQGNQSQALPASRSSSAVNSLTSGAVGAPAGNASPAASTAFDPATTVPPGSSVSAGQQPATSRAQAAEQARIGAGRNNPFSGIEGGYQPFPSRGANAPTNDSGGGEKTLARKRADIGPFVPPPPPSAVGSRPSGGHESIVPPPPPEGTLDPKELPAPPDKPSIAAKLKLVGIIGDRALFIFTDPLMRDQHKWPRNISLGVGEMFESVSVVNVTPDSVTIEEDGDRSVRELPRIR